MATIEERLSALEEQLGDTNTERLLRDLLARIHRDGGHYTHEHGLEKAAADAHDVWSALMISIETIETARRGCEEQYQERTTQLGKSEDEVRRLIASVNKRTTQCSKYENEIRRLLEHLNDVEGERNKACVEVKRLREQLTCTEDDCHRIHKDKMELWHKEREAQVEVERLQEALGVLGNAADLVHKEAAIIQPFLSVWKQYGEVIEEARAAFNAEDIDDC